MKLSKLFFALLISAFLVSACSSDKGKSYIQFPVDTMIKDLGNTQNYSVMLYDMNVKDKKYYHKYKLIKQTRDIEEAKDSTGAIDSLAMADTTVTAADMGFEESITDWKEVSKEDFDYHSSDMGMVIASKTNGELTKVAAPPGYSQYVGNEKYGQWKTDNNGDRFWSFYGRYMFMRTMFHMMMPVPYGYYGGYYGGYRGVRPYYGPSTGGKYAYGTGSKHASKVNPGFAQRMNSNSSLKNRVNKSVSRSARATGGVRTAATTQRKTGRGSSRYSRSSSRSRSWGGGGK